MTTLHEPLSNTTQASAAQYARHRRRNRRLRAVFVYGVLTLVSLIFLLPLTWMIVTALKTPQEAILFPPTIIPRRIAWENFAKAWTFPGMQFTRWTINTLVISVTVLIGVLLPALSKARGRAQTVLPAQLQYFSFPRVRFVFFH
jgi:multiple sugar transport system permease protein